MIQRKIKVLHLIKSLGRGGAEKLIPETVKAHDKKNFEFYCLYFYHQQNNIVDELEEAGIAVTLIPSGNLSLLFQVKKVQEFVQKHQIDLIHAHLPWAGILSRLVGNRSSLPIVYTEHNTWDRYNKFSYWGNRLTFKHQDIAIAVSNEVALSMKLNSMLDPYRRGGRLKVKVIQNGVNTEVFKRMSDVRCQNHHGDQVSDVEEGNDRNGEESPDNYRGENRDPDNYRGENWIIENGDSDNYRGENDSTDSYRGENGEKQKETIENEEVENERITSGRSRKVESPNLPISQSLNPSISEPTNIPFSQSLNLKSQLGIPKHAKVIGKVAVFRSQKRLWIWVELALQILERCPETHFLLVGDGEWRDRILEQIRVSEKEAHFHWVGVQKQVIPYLSIMDIYLSTSEFEGLPIAMLEAMSCEVPVVATSAGGIGEMVQHGVQGFLTPIEDYADLVDYCVELLENTSLHTQFAKAARERVFAEFSMKRMVEELEGVYEGVIGKSVYR